MKNFLIFIFLINISLFASPSQTYKGELICKHSTLNEKLKYLGLKPFYHHVQSSDNVVIIYNSKQLDFKISKNRQRVHRYHEVKAFHVFKGSIKKDSTIRILVDQLNVGYYMFCLKEVTTDTFHVIKHTKRALLFKPYIPKNKTVKEQLKDIFSAQAYQAQHLHKIFMIDLKEDKQTK